jgi:hypothetical protein
MDALLFLPRRRHAGRVAPSFPPAHFFADDGSAGAEGNGEMRQLRSLLRAARARIGRRFAQIVAIAAASLPAAGV